ncbi:MerR family transcriptional regulator [Leifsonia sp. F6_8S_P_1B]|uniref:MerR family transcriptional regulator n=1 Tax=Leifsonia williamsii TaxID=3035919 RepID=A0ABT8K934_9MICO|nr:MerR family transcriptional regulator [Leifsonia williamsii]MDN4613974.1 MerR family transcriptional regulator [Leifsonia williamsii]
MTDRAGDTPLYSIAVAAQLSGLTPAALRLYEEKGLLTPARSEGGTRRYSEDDLARLREVARLQDDGINLAGIGHVMRLQDENAELRRRLAES